MQPNLADLLARIQRLEAQQYQTTKDVEDIPGQINQQIRIASQQVVKETVTVSSGGEGKIAIGGVYISTVSTNPSNLLGYGTWSLIEECFLVGYKSGDADFGTLGATGGQRSIDLAHVHSMQDHTHNIEHSHEHPHTHPIDHVHGTGTPLAAGTDYDSEYVGDSGAASDETTGASSESASGTPSTANTDSKLSSTQSVLPPFRVVYMWERVG